ncbi:hypothetical protein GGH96_004164, partial [Coemansia sp. RSA 1972]
MDQRMFKPNSQNKHDVQREPVALIIEPAHVGRWRNAAQTGVNFAGIINGDCVFKASKNGPNQIQPGRAALQINIA